MRSYHLQLTTKLFEGMEVGMVDNDDLHISYIQFANGTIFFGKAVEVNIWAAKCILWIFEVAFGLEINYIKSGIYGIYTEKDLLKKMTYLLNCNVGKMPLKYVVVLVLKTITMGTVGERLQVEIIEMEWSLVIV